MSSQVYRCQVRTSVGAEAYVDVDAETGDEAALGALRSYPGGYVASVVPAPQSAQKSTLFDADELAA